jgi:hypothetical protein
MYSTLVTGLKEIAMARDPNEIPESDIAIDSDEESVVDPDLQPYDETVETPLKDTENFIRLKSSSPVINAVMTVNT